MGLHLAQFELLSSHCESVRESLLFPDLNKTCQPIFDGIEALSLHAHSHSDMQMRMQSRTLCQALFH